MGEKPDMRTKLDFLYKEMLGEVGDILQKLESAKNSINETADSAVSRLREETEAAGRTLNALSGQILANHERNNKIYEAIDLAFRQSVQNQSDQFAKLAETLTAAAAEKSVSEAIEKSLDTIRVATENQANLYKAAVFNLTGEIEKNRESSLQSIKLAVTALHDAQKACIEASKKDSKRFIYGGVFVGLIAVISISAAMVLSDTIRGGPVATPQTLKNAELGEAFTRSFVYLDPATQQKVNGALTKVTQSQ